MPAQVHVGAAFERAAEKLDPRQVPWTQVGLVPTQPCTSAGRRWPEEAERLPAAFTYASVAAWWV